ncbi:PucR family transcriptional regulator [Streptomyces endophyticus]|uniref:PucR family transcriptional regulator n=1 Tax=Streptomyces endophyticus TaxID=714166 RepID=A0ABU6F048_9ACTN|nr:PucR family transcriptional regulator [Streptomyces endophyticus]MEB8337342.1 PucR family transcriptional regulator [Streptomyces endophyticus]
MTVTAPPTQGVPLAAVLSRADLGLRQIAGPAAADVLVHGAHTSELTDPEPYLLGGELLLTAGVHAPAAPGDSYFEEYAERVARGGAVALGFGVTPVFDTVPPELVTACERRGIPLLEVPPRTTFSGVARAVWELMAQARNAELRRVTEAQQALASAAARPDPLPSVLRQLAQRTGGFAVAVTPEGDEPHHAGKRPPRAVSEALAELTAVVRPHATHLFPTPSSAADTVGGTHLSAYALQPGGALGLATQARSPGDHTIAGAAVVLLSLLTGEHRSTGDTRRAATLVDLLLGADRAQAATDLLGADTTWRVIHARPLTPRPAPDLATPLTSTATDDSVTRALVPSDQDVTAYAGHVLGVSAPALARDLPLADVQAAHALTRARSTRSPLAHHRPDGTPAPTLAALSGKPALLETLRTWLSLHGSWESTALALTVHRNTVRQRIARCATLLEADLDDPDTRMELWFALRHMS